MEAITRITAEETNGKALIRITDVISDEMDTGSTNIRYQIDGFLKNNIKMADVYINSKGGDVFEAVEIVNQLNRFSEVVIYLGSIAASAATYITSSFKTIAKPDTKLMIHKPKMVVMGNEDEIASSLKLLKDGTADYCRTYANKTGKSFAQVQSILSNGDVWMTAQEALKDGYIDAIEENTPYSKSEDKSSNNVKATKMAALFETESELLKAMGGKPGISMSDYLTNDPEAYYAMKEKHPLLAEKVEQLHLKAYYRR